MKLSRRRFLADVSAGLGGWLIAPGTTHRIVTAAFDYKEILKVEMPKPSIQLFAYPTGYDDRLSLSLGPWPDEDAIWPTWQEYLSFKKVNFADPEEIEGWMIHEGHFDPDGEEMFQPPTMGDRIPEHIFYDCYIDLERYDEEWQAYDYLRGLPLASEGQAGESQFGGLTFFDAPGMACNRIWVEADNLVVVSALQQRLVQLNQNTQVVLGKDTPSLDLAPN